MLRHTLLIRLKPGVTDEQVEVLVAALDALSFPGRSNVLAGRDIGIRPGNMDLVLSNDFTDEATYRAWGEFPEHVKIRNELLTPIAERVERCLFHV